MSFTIRFNEELPRDLRKFISSMLVTAAMNSVGESCVALEKKKFIQNDGDGNPLSSEPEEAWFLTNLNGVPYFRAVPKVKINPQELPFQLQKYGTVLRKWDKTNRCYKEVPELILVS